MSFIPVLSGIQDGSMRFRWNESNGNRLAWFQKQGIGQPVFSEVEKVFTSDEFDKTLISIELIHSRLVYDLQCGCDGQISAFDANGNMFPLKGLQGDGFITTDKRLVPCVTVADCMPLWFSDEESGVFGVVHSGWKGTGIIVNALELAEKRYGTKKENVHITIGPHIHDCCYNVDPERVTFFSAHFGANCINWREEIPYLSLQQANLNALNDFGVPLNHITISDQCTCCTRTAELFRYGSFRRQTADLPLNMPFEEKSRCFTVMAAAAVMN